MRARIYTAAAFVCTALVTGCSDTSEPVDQAATSSPSSTSTSSAADQSPSDDVPDATPLPSELPDGARQPADQALAAMTAYVDHSGDAAAWFARLSPYLSRQAAEQYQYTDPANVPATQIVGVPAIISATDYLVTVDQGTDAGTHRLLLSRAADGSWQVESITPPETGPVT